MTDREPGPPRKPQQRLCPPPAVGHHPKIGLPYSKTNGGPQALPPSPRATPSHHSTQDSDHQVLDALGSLPTLCTRARVVPSNPAGVLGMPCCRKGGAWSTPSTAPHPAAHLCGREKAAFAASFVPLHPLVSKGTDPQPCVPAQGCGFPAEAAMLQQTCPFSGIPESPRPKTRLRPVHPVWFPAPPTRDN